MITCID